MSLLHVCACMRAGTCLRVHMYVCVCVCVCVYVMVCVCVQKEEELLNAQGTFDMPL